MKKIQMGQDRNLFYNYWHILVGDRTKKYPPEMPDWRVLGCTCQGGHMSHFAFLGGEQKYQVTKLVK